MTRSTDPVDSWLLRVLVTLVTERNVSRTAIRLNQSQPAISTALKRLREVFDDPLLVRERGGMAPTDRALALREHARRALAEIEAMRAGAEAFDPASSPQTFRVGSPDFMVASFLAGAVERFSREAPRARLVVQPLGADFDYERALAMGELDVVIGNWPQPPQHLHLSVLLEDDVVCVMSRHDPRAARGLTREQYLAARHVVPMPYSKAQRGVVETHLATLRVARDARVVVPFFELAPYMVANTDLVFTTSRHFAAHYARMLPLAVSPAPFDFPRMRFYQMWHERSQHSPAHRWFRALLSEAARPLSASARDIEAA
jgi:DNA-binding transcriptional LysR family regulator